MFLRKKTKRSSWAGKTTARLDEANWWRVGPARSPALWNSFWHGRGLKPCLCGRELLPCYWRLYYSFLMCQEWKSIWNLIFMALIRFKNYQILQTFCALINPKVPGYNGLDYILIGADDSEISGKIFWPGSKLFSIYICFRGLNFCSRLLGQKSKTWKLWDHWSWLLSKSASVKRVSLNSWLKLLAST